MIFGVQRTSSPIDYWHNLYFPIHMRSGDARYWADTEQEAMNWLEEDRRHEKVLKEIAEKEAKIRKTEYIYL